MADLITNNTNYRKMETNIHDRDTDSYIIKANNLVESSYQLTMTDQRLIYLASKKLKHMYVNSNIKTIDIIKGHYPKELRTVRIYVTEYRTVFDLNSNGFYPVLKRAAQRLNKKCVKYARSKNREERIQILEHCNYNSDTNYVEMTFNQELLLDLLAMKGKFGSIDYNVIKYLKSSYPARFYELFVDYSYRGGRTISVSELKHKLGLNDTNYPNFREFNRTVIKPALAYINEYTNLIVELETIRHGRFVRDLSFKVYTKYGFKKYDAYDEKAVDGTQIERMREITGFILTPSQIAELTNLTIEAIRKHQINMSFYEYIKYEIDMLKQYSKVTPIENFYSSLQTAITSYWDEHTIANSKVLINNFKDVEPDQVQMSFLF